MKDLSTANTALQVMAVLSNFTKVAIFKLLVTGPGVAAEALAFCGQSCSSDETKTSGIHCEKWIPAPGTGQCQAKAFCSSSTPSGNCDVVLGKAAMALQSAGWRQPAKIQARANQPARASGLRPFHFRPSDK